MKTYAALALALTTLCSPVHAASWQICRLDVQIVNVLKQPYPQLQGRILKVAPTSPTTQCPQQGPTVTFTPETTDYQNTLPRRQWPRKGQSVQIDYRYLDGICKGDGHPHPCRIEHYPLMGR